MDIISHGPEVPDPAQITLFDLDTIESVTVHYSTDADMEDQSNDLHIRSPTHDDERNFDMNEAQRSFASSLYRKSRELVKKSIEKRIQEDDLAR